MAAGDKLLLDSDVTDNLLLDSDVADVLLLEAAAAGGYAKTIIGVSTYSKINGVAVAGISKVNGVAA